MLVATSETRLGGVGMRSTLVLERAVRGTVVRREGLAFDTRFAAPVSGKCDQVGHVFLLVAGRLISDRGEPVAAPVGFMLADDEIERVGAKSRTFRTDGQRVHVIQLRIDRSNVRVPIGFGAGPLAVTPATWDAAAAMIDGELDALARQLAALASSGVIADVTQTLCADEPERYRRLWSTLQPLYETYGASMSIKQIASTLGMSLRQVGRDAKDLTSTFGLGRGYRNALLVLRLRVAALMLSAPDASIADVAQAVGYGGAIAMARAFRDAGLPSPSAIRSEYIASSR